MLFNSYIFWAFFAIVILIYSRARHRWQNIILLAASYIFYGWWDWRFLSLVAASTMIDFACTRLMAAPGATAARRKSLLVVSIVSNLAFLGFFKYFNFFAGELAGILSTLGFQANLPALQIILPVGISFYTFQTMSYSIDVYKGRAQPVRRFLDFALYVAFFPQLVAGPIERFNRLMPQIENPRVHRQGDFAEGLYHILLGLFKKVVIADNMATITNAVFAAGPGQATGADMLLAIYAFAFQIYGDFSGYSSMAQGLAKWLGFDLIYNFKMPYFAVSPSDFWTRWHISLSAWLRDYLYIPLGGNRKGSLNTYRNLMLTMLLGGLWHGASWTFVAWGAYQGAILIIYRLLEQAKKSTREVVTTWPRKVVAGVVMFHLTCIGWLLFRADNLGQAWLMLRGIATDFRFSEFSAYALGSIVFFVGPLLLLEYWIHRRDDMIALLRVRWQARAAAYSYFVFMLWFFAPEVSNEFIYFQF